MARARSFAVAAAPHAVLPLGAALLLAVFVVLWLDFQPLYFRLLAAGGLYPFRFPFLDTHAVLAAIECQRLGFDVYAANPCDVLNRPHVYSPLFLALSFLPISVRDTPAVGVTLSVGFILALAAVPPPSGRRAWLVLLLTAASDMTVYAVERGNNDLIIFIAVAIAGWLMLSAAVARGAGYALLMLAALLKFYPLALMVLALRERPRTFVAVAVAATAVLLAFVAHYRAALAAAIPSARQGLYFTDFFGAVNLPFGLARLLSPVGDLYPAAAPVLRYLPWVLLLALAVRCLREAVGIAAGAVRARVAALPPAPGLFLTVGAILIVACFFAGQNIGYRGVFFLFLLPGLCALGRGPDGRLFWRAAVAIVFLSWSEFFRHAIQVAATALELSPTASRGVQAVFWLVKELVWWRVIAVLAGLILCFVATSEIGGATLGRLAPRRAAEG